MLCVSETGINVTEGHGIFEVPVYETDFSEPGELFRACQKEHGRCVSSIYLDTPSGTVRTGWVFQSRRPYSDSAETYLHETWVSLFERPSKTVTQHFPLVLN